MSDVAQEQASALIQHFAEAASSVLSQISGTALEAKPSALAEATDAATLIRIDISGSLTGQCEIALSAAMSAQFSALLTGETLEPGIEITADTVEAAAELIQQICGNAADRLRGAFGPLELKPAPTTERNSDTGDRQLLVIARDNDVLEFELHIVSLSVTVREEAEPEAKNAASSTQNAPAPSALPPATELAPSASRNLDLLLDIELSASLRFGTRQMLLKDIIELCSGSVVELDRRVQDPVELLIDGRVIAKGEVVIVEGNYGLRILQVAAPSDKVACLL